MSVRLAAHWTATLLAAMALAAIPLAALKAGSAALLVAAGTGMAGYATAPDIRRKGSRP